jgi:hypothetical protein
MEGTWGAANAGRGFLWVSLIWLKIDPPGEVTVITSLPRNLIPRQMNFVQAKTLSKTLSCSSKGPLIFLRNPLSPLVDLEVSNLWISLIWGIHFSLPWCSYAPNTFVIINIFFHVSLPCQFISDSKIQLMEGSRNVFPPRLLECNQWEIPGQKYPAKLFANSWHSSTPNNSETINFCHFKLPSLGSILLCSLKWVRREIIKLKENEISERKE